MDAAPIWWEIAVAFWGYVAPVVEAGLSWWARQRERVWGGGS